MTFAYSMSYIFGKLWHLAIIWAIRKAFQCILQGVRFLLANHTRLSPTSDNESYSLFIIFVRIWCIFNVYHFMFTIMFVIYFLTLPLTIHLISGTSGYGFSKKWIHISHFCVCKLWKIPISDVLKIID